jgi:hypothetical protein
MSERVDATDAVAFQMVGGNQQVDGCVPQMRAAFACGDSNGIIWTAEQPHNVVVDLGKGHILNGRFGGLTSSSAGIFGFMHSATTNGTCAWSNISASEVISYGNNRPLVTFNTNYVSNSATATASFGFTASTQTVSGFGLMFYTTNTVSTNAATANILMYNLGQFAASQQVQNANTVTVSITLSM